MDAIRAGAALLPEDLKDEAAGKLPRLVDGQPG